MAQKEPRLEVDDYTGSVKGLVDFLKEHYPDGPPGDTGEYTRHNALPISDVVDRLGRQCADLVQEGGGVHGIALAGYTYVLEKMGVTFTKMAGTSAGAINTMLLNAVLTQKEHEALLGGDAHKHAYTVPGQEVKYYDTRSEKLLEYLADKNLSDLVDGHPAWRRILLDLFTGEVKMDSLKAEVRWWKRIAIVTVLSLTLVLLCALFLFFGHNGSSLTIWFEVIGAIALFTTFGGLAWLIARGRQARLLYFLSENLGINPGHDFERWLEEKLAENGVHSIDSLREKIELESEVFGACYKPVMTPGVNGADPAGRVVRDGHELAFQEDLGAIEQAFEELQEQGPALTNARLQRRIDAIWDNLVAIAKDLPAGDPLADSIAYRRASVLMPLFRKCMQMQDDACGYSKPGAAGPYTKELTLVATDITNEIKVEFPAMHKLYWGDRFNISPAAYVRASMAVPLFFQPFKVPVDPAQVNVMEEEWMRFMKVRKRQQAQGNLDPDKDVTLFVDGGVVSNFPINIYATPEAPIPRKPTLGVRLEFEDEALSNSVGNLLGEMGSIISTMRFFYDRDFISKNDLYKRTVRSIDTGKIHWLNFGLTEREKLELFFRGALTATLFLLRGHPSYDAMRSVWTNHLLDIGERVPCAKDIRDSSNGSISIYKLTSRHHFRNEDLENPSIRFNWSDYKMERLLALSRQKDQRRQLKTFPK